MRPDSRIFVAGHSPRWTTRALLVVVSTALSVLVVEVACQVYVRVFLADRPLGRGEFRATRPLAFPRADSLSPDFIREQDRFEYFLAASGKHWLLADVAGHYVNVVNGLRRTTNQPPRPERRLLVFGGSTVMSAEVPDQYTIPSVLQRAINASCETSVVVLNYGVDAMNAGQQRSRLMEAGVSPNDIVVFYDGINDVLERIFAGGREWESESGFDRLWRAIDHASDISALALLAVDARYRAVPETLADATILRRSLDRAEEEYRHELVAAHQLVGAGQGEFIHFLQPHLFATPLSTAYRREISSNYRETPMGLDTAFRLGYPRLREALANASRNGVVSFDLSGLLTAERVPDEVFLDFAHVNDIGNEMIARAMFARIADRIGDCDPSRHQPPLLLEKR